MTVFYLAMKDLRLLWRDKATIFWVIGFPFVMAILFGSIFSGIGSSSPKMKLGVVDLDQSEFSQALITKIDENETFDVSLLPYDQARDLVRRGKLSAYLAIPESYGASQGFVNDTTVQLEIGIDPSSKTTLGILQGTLTGIGFTLKMERFFDPSGSGMDFDRMREQIDQDNDIPADQKGLLNNFFGSMEEMMQGIDSNQIKEHSVMSEPAYKVTSITDDRAMPKSSFEITFPSAILWGLLACAATFAVSIVSEKVRGTYARLRISPITRAHILAGKGLACYLSSLFTCVLLLVVGSTVFNVSLDQPIKLAMALLAAGACFVGLMMLISVIGKTEEAVGGMGWAVMLMMAMTGGGMVPLLFMPGWMKAVSNFSPVKWGIVAIEGAIWRGYSYAEMMTPVGILLSIGLVSFVIGVIVLKRTDH